MKICAYVQSSYSKSNYANECMDSRQFVGLRMVIDSIERCGYSVEYAGEATVHRYDVVLVSLTSDCDWWSYIQERLRWQRGDYKVIIGGAGVLHVAPFLPFGDYFVLGRGEETVINLIKAIDGKGGGINESVVISSQFSVDRIYKIQQADQPYPHALELKNRKSKYVESTIGCNHRCLFCGYTWQRRFVSPYDYYAMSDGLFGNIEDRERAMLDIQRNPDSVNFSLLRTTAIDGVSERLRMMVNKRITKVAMVDFLSRMISSPAKPHQLKIYNIIGYPSETIEDWWEFIDTIKQADDGCCKKDKQWSIVLHSTPFRAMPATPLACAPMSKHNYRGEIAKQLGKGLRGNLIYQGQNLWAVESMGTDSLPSVMLSAIAHRANEKDSENIIKLCKTKKFWGAAGAVKQATLEKYFDMDHLFGEFTPETLPSRYLRTYCAVEKLWGKRLWS